MLDLSPRLKTIAQQVPQGAKFADIGTDHAYLPVWLLKNRKISYAIASDLRQAPLNNGMKVAKHWNIPPEEISFRCSDGLVGINRNEVDTIAIAGMGGDTIAHALQGVSWSRDPELLFLLQPMSSIPELRLWLQKNGFCIDLEIIVPEQEKLYVIMSVTYGKMQVLSLGEQWVGRQWCGMPADYRLDYIEDTIRRRQRALDGMMQSDARCQDAAVDELKQIIHELHQMREEWLSWQQ